MLEHSTEQSRTPKRLFLIIMNQMICNFLRIFNSVVIYVTRNFLEVWYDHIKTFHSVFNRLKQFFRSSVNSEVKSVLKS